MSDRYSLTPYRSDATTYLSRVEAVSGARDAVKSIGLIEVRVTTILAGSRFYGVVRGQDAVGFIKRAS